VILVNMSGQRRQVRLTSGDLDLPVGAWVAIDSHVGATLYIVSDAKTSVDEKIAVKSEDDARILRVR
jgi:hydrogenase maturation factor